MFNRSKTVNRVSEETRKAVSDYLVDYVKRNPNKSIPSTRIGEMFDTAPYNVATITKQLIRFGEIEKVTSGTYRAVENPAIPKPKQSNLLPVTAMQQVAIEVEKLAKDYVWQTDDPTLKGFIDWLKV